MQSMSPGGRMGRVLALLVISASSSLVTGQTVVPEISPEIYSAWKVPGENALVIFRHDGTYFMVQDSGNEIGMERGIFTWDKATSAFSATAVVDTNGEAGLSHPEGATTLSISGNTMILTIVNEGSFELSRVENTASPIVGSWFIPGERASVTFLADGTYYLTDEKNDAPLGYDGMERGTYTWDSGSKVFTATPITDTNGDIGLSGLPPGFTADIVGNAMTMQGDGDTTILRRITPIQTPLNTENDFEVDKFSNYRQTSTSTPSLLPGAPDDAPYWGESYIGDGVPGVGGTLTIAGQSPRNFIDDTGWEIATEYPDLTALNHASAFPNGTNYVFARDGGSATLSYPAGGTFPNAPQIVGDGDNGRWDAGKYLLGRSQTLIWSAHTAYDPATLVTVLTVIDQDSGDRILDEAIIQGDITSFDFSGNLNPGSSYDVQIEHVKIADSTTAGTGAFAGKLGYALYNSNTRFTMVAPDSANSSPIISEQPQSQNPAENSTVILTVGTLDEDPTQTYQWYRDDMEIPGQTGNSLIIRGFTLAENAGSYNVVVTNSFGETSSDSATLRAPFVEALGINRIKSAVQQTASTTVASGAGFDVFVEGEGLSLTFPATETRLSKPDNSLISLVFDEDRWYFKENFASEAAMLSAFPDGDYQFRMGSDIVPASMTSSAYPVQPVITSSAGTWEAGKLRITASQAAAGFTLTTNATSAGEFAFLSIHNPADESIYEFGVSHEESPTLQADIPESLMSPGNRYQVEVEVDRVIDSYNISSFAWMASEPEITTVYSIQSSITTITIEIIPDPFNAWADDFFSPAELANPSICGPNIDFDSDGIPNLTEFLLGGNPKVSSKAILPVLTTTPIAGGRNLNFTYRRNLAASGISEVVEHSADLSTEWTVAVHGQSGVTVAISPVDSLTEQVTVTIPTSGSRHFVRLGVPGAAVAYNPETSYQNFKNAGLQPQKIPVPEGMNSLPLARAYGDFFGDGTIGLFTASIQYSPEEPISSATPSEFAFWRRQPDGTFVKDANLLTGNSGCIHPRKALVADFNGDGRPDVFVACHGFDANPFPGERNRIVLSQPGGTYSIAEAAPNVAFYHGAAAADVDRDGDIDVIAVRGGGGSQQVLLNRGDGSFVKELDGRLPASISNKNYFTVELLDVNEDSWPDLLVGGHEWEGAPTQVYLNPGDFNFSTVTPIDIPAVDGEGVVLDFVTTGTGSQRALWILRSSGGDGSFYQSRTIQKVMWSSKQSSVPLQENPASWIPWLIPMQSGGQSGVGGDAFGSGVFVPQ